jgi:hypothetical protein
MKKLSVGFFVMVLLLTACAPVTMEQPGSSNGDTYPYPSYPSPSYPNDDLSADMTPAQQAALTHLSVTLNLPADQINLVSTEAVTWPDGCLGVQRPDVMCTQALVEGYQMIFDANGTEYELHTNETGSAVVIASGLDVNSLIEPVLIRQLAGNLGLDAETVSVVSNEPADFDTTCLGVTMQDVMCAEVVTPGRIIILESDDVRYEYHVSDDGRIIQPATLALTWKREGGIAGFCNSLTVFLSGEIYGNQCKSQPNGVMGNFATLLSLAEKDQFGAWIEEYGSVTLDASDPEGVSDRMTLSLVLHGRGAGKPSQDVQGELFTWAQNLHGRLYE